jgi:hypothetical protein
LRKAATELTYYRLSLCCPLPRRPADGTQSPNASVLPRMAPNNAALSHKIRPVVAASLSVLSTPPFKAAAEQDSVAPRKHIVVVGPEGAITRFRLRQQEKLVPP